MKASACRLIVPILFAAGLAGCQSEPTPPAPAESADGRVTVIFHEPENFTDARDRPFGDTQQSILDGATRLLQAEIGRLLPAGQTMKVTVTDIDLAGDFEPWRGPAGASDVRIIKSIYPPRLEVSYVRTGADGQVIDQGKDVITDLAFQMRSGLRTDPYFYEKDLVREWIRRKLR